MEDKKSYGFFLFVRDNIGIIPPETTFKEFCDAVEQGVF